MPTYEYHCEKCGYSLEALQKMTAEPLKMCPECQTEGLKRGPGGGIGLSFKGSGFYITDYCDKSQKKECVCKSSQKSSKESS